MNIALPTITAFLLSTFCGLAQLQPSVPIPPLPDGSLDRNYVLHLLATQAGTNQLAWQCVTAKRDFMVTLDQPALTFSGRLFLQPDDRAFLEFKLLLTRSPEEGKKRGGQSQANNQMFASLVAFVVKSALTYNPQQHEAHRDDAPGPQPLSISSAVWLKLGQASPLWDTGREVYQVKVEKQPEGGE